MPKYIFNPPAIGAAAIEGEELRFPVGRIYCVGRNYADHAREMGINPRAEEPFFFLKPADTIRSPNANEAIEAVYPPKTESLHHEVELVVAIGKEGHNIPVDQAIDHIWGYAVGVDLTRRDLQLAMRADGKPWEIGKTFEACAPISPIVPLSRCGEIVSGAIALTVGPESRQASDVSKMIWSVSEIIAKLSEYFALRPGDLLFTGTPEGVGAVIPGDVMTASVEGVGTLQVAIAARSPRA